MNIRANNAARIALYAAAGLLLWGGPPYEVRGVHDYARVGIVTIFVDFPQATKGPDANLVATTCEVLDLIVSGDIRLKRTLQQYNRVQIDYSAGLGRAGVPAGFGHAWPEKVEEEMEHDIGYAYLGRDLTGIVSVAVERTDKGPRMEMSQFAYPKDCTRPKDEK